MQIEPETKIVQSHFGSQASLKPRQVMGTFPCQAEGIQEFVVDGSMICRRLANQRRKALGQRMRLLI